MTPLHACRYGRTPNPPFADLKHPGYHLPHPTVKPAPCDVDRYSRHGWGTTQKFAGQVYGRDTIRGKFHDTEKESVQVAEDERRFRHTGLRPVAGAGPGMGANRPPPTGRTNPSGRVNLFQTLQYSKPEPPEKGDSWIGNAAYEPSKGRIAPPAPVTRGRKDLFDIVNHTGRRKPGDTSGDAWIGNHKVDPFHGKGTVPAPPKRRKDLFPTIQQTATKPGEKRDPDSWVGNKLIDPTKGKSQGSLNPIVVGQVPLEPVLAHQYLSERVPHVVTSRAPPCEIGEVMVDNPKPGRPVAQGRRVLEPFTGRTGRKGLFGILANDPRELSDVEPQGRRYLEAPGHDVPGKGRILLYWNGEK